MKTKAKTWLKSQYAHMLYFPLIVSLLIFSFIRLNDVIKWIGYPFQVIPNTLGITQSVKKDEVYNFDVLVNSEVEIFFQKPGHYNIFTSFFYEWSIGPDIKISSSDGREIRVDQWRGVSRPYDTIMVSGSPSHRFYVSEAGKYKFLFVPSRVGSLYPEIDEETGESEYGLERTPSTKKFRIGVAPDYVTGYEASYNIAYAIQVTLILVAIITRYYLKIGREAIRQRNEVQSQRMEKKKKFDEFVKKKSSKEWPPNPALS